MIERNAEEDVMTEKESPSSAAGQDVDEALVWVDKCFLQCQIPHCKFRSSHSAHFLVHLSDQHKMDSKSYIGHIKRTFTVYATVKVEAYWECVFCQKYMLHSRYGHFLMC